MSYIIDFLQFIIFIAVLTFLSIPLGNYFAKVFSGENNLLSPFLSGIEKWIYRFIGINPEKEMRWKDYTMSILVFGFAGIVVLLFIQLIQFYLPLNPQKIGNVPFLLALNTAISFVTNTDWQSYSGETTLSNFTQMIGLTVQNFISAATGISVLLALIKGITKKNGTTIGNFWVDLTRSILYILLPLSFIVAILLLIEGVVQTFSPSIIVTTIEGSRQIIPLGPVASQIAIKQLGTNGGGFFGTNSSFPFENPTFLSNFIQSLSILLIPSALVFTYGKMLNNRKHAVIVFIVMMFVFCSGVIVSYYSETSSANNFNTFQLLEGKETRFGVFNSVLWSVATSAASNGSVNSMHCSLSPLSGMIAMLNIQLGEIIFGGVGSGMYGIFLFIILTVFISGLMIGRTPEYFGKKIEAFEIKWAIIAILLPSIIMLFFTAIALNTKPGLSAILNNGPHGLSEILYAFSSTAGNNGSS